MKRLFLKRGLLCCVLSGLVALTVWQALPGVEAETIDPSAIKVIPSLSIPAGDAFCPTGFANRGEGDHYVCERRLKPQCYPHYRETGLTVEGDRVSYACETMGIIDRPSKYQCATEFTPTSIKPSRYVCEMDVRRVCYSAYRFVSGLELDSTRLFYTCDRYQ